MGVAALVVVSLGGCALAGGASSAGGGQSVDIGRLDAVKLSDLLPTTEEVNRRLGWTDNVNFDAPDFSSFESFDAAGLVDAAGGPLALGVGCADAIKKYGVIAGGPIGAAEVAANMWADESLNSVRELWLARYPSADAAAAQVAGLPAVIDACPSFNLVPGGRTVTVIPSKLDGAVAYRASDSYSWVVASFGNLVAQVEIGTSDEELAAGESLVQLQFDKLELISRGTYK